MNFLNKNYGFNDYNMPILPYRISGSNEYSESDIIDLTEDKIAILNDIFNTNNREVVVLKIKILNKEYHIDYNEKKIIVEPEKYADYLKVNIYQVIDENNKILINDSLNIYSFNDGKYGVDLNTNRRSKFNICEDFDGLLKYLYDIGFIINLK